MVGFERSYLVKPNKGIIHHFKENFKRFYLQYGNKPCNIFVFEYGMI